MIDRAPKNSQNFKFNSGHRKQRKSNIPGLTYKWECEHEI